MALYSLGPDTLNNIAYVEQTLRNLRHIHES